MGTLIGRCHAALHVGDKVQTIDNPAHALPIRGVPHGKIGTVRQVLETDGEEGQFLIEFPMEGQPWFPGAGQDVEFQSHTGVWYPNDKDGGKCIMREDNKDGTYNIRRTINEYGGYFDLCAQASDVRLIRDVDYPSQVLEARPRMMR